MRPPRSILITGASSGIGRAVAVEYAAPGVRLVLVGRDTPGSNRRPSAAAQGARRSRRRWSTCATGRRCTISSAPPTRRRPLDLVMANAGINTGLPAGALAEDPEAVRGILSINLIGALNTVEPIIEPMCARGRGVIALTGSIAAIRGLPIRHSYCAFQGGGPRLCGRPCAARSPARAWR